MTGVANASQVAMLSVLRRWIGAMHREELVALKEHHKHAARRDCRCIPLLRVVDSYFDEVMDFLGIAKCQPANAQPMFLSDSIYLTTGSSRRRHFGVKNRTSSGERVDDYSNFDSNPGGAGRNYELCTISPLHSSFQHCNPVYSPADSLNHTLILCSY